MDWRKKWFSITGNNSFSRKTKQSWKCLHSITSVMAKLYITSDSVKKYVITMKNDQQIQLYDALNKWRTDDA